MVSHNKISNSLISCISAEFQQRCTKFQIVVDPLSQEEDPNKLWCLCRKPEGGQFMIQCDHGEWLHGDCVGASCSQSQQLEENGEKFLCPLCNPQTCLPVNQSASFIWGTGIVSYDFFSRLNITYFEVVHWKQNTYC